MRKVALSLVVSLGLVVPLLAQPPQNAGTSKDAPASNMPRTRLGSALFSRGGPPAATQRSSAFDAIASRGTPVRSALGATTANLLHPLTRDAGPVLVLVTTFLGPTATEQANKLVTEFRNEHRLTAYTFARLAEPEIPRGPKRSRGFYERVDQVAVFAGEFPDLGDKAQKQLKKIKQLQAKCLPGESAPFRGAILITNPMIPPAERAQHSGSDPLVEKMNRGEHSLYHCRGKYSLQVAHFSGTKASSPEDAKKLERIVKESPAESKLQLAGEEAERLARALRKAGHEAYVFHGLQYSLVAVGAFNAADDPKLEVVRRQLAGTTVDKFKLLPNPRPVLVPKRS